MSITSLEDFINDCLFHGIRYVVLNSRAGLVAENIAVGQTSPQALMNTWMSSSGHRKNILLGRGASQYGVGIADAGNAYTHGYLWVLVVARGC